MSKSRLGKGLGALLSTTTAAQTSAQTTQNPAQPSAASSAGLMNVNVTDIVRSPYQPRRHFDEAALAELAASISAQGVLQPLVVRSRAQGGFELIAGERRWRAAQQAGLSQVPALRKEVTDQEASTIALVENIQREDLGALEQAIGLERLRSEFELTQQQLADIVGKSRAAIANSLRLLSLGSPARRLLEMGNIETGHAKALLGLTGLQQDQAAERVARDGLSVRATETLVRQLLAGEKPREKDRTQPDADVQTLQRRLMDHLGASTLIKQKRDGTGEVIIKYASLEELDGVLRRIQLPE
ncbi:MAG: ParB/RepB/Spo0J family partition protein [Proteobacteria bacterium]|nr:ParB/RepB/Spo0J family partition protein [Pseudomonadota bacterium]